MKHAIDVIGAITVAIVIFLGLYFLNSRQTNREYSRIKLPDGAIIECQHIETCCRSCVVISRCKDGIERCMASYEVIREP